MTVHLIRNGVRMQSYAVTVTVYLIRNGVNIQHILSEEPSAIPKSFIFCRQDRAMPPGYFHPGMSSRLGTHKLVEMDGSHEAMFTRPAELADKIIEASSD